MGYEAYGEDLNVTDCGALTRFAGNVAEKFGTIDVWVNNAGTNYYKMIIDFEVDEWKEAVDLNMNSAFFAAKAVVPIMRKNGGGVILNNASYAGVMPQVGKGCYAAAKSGMISLTRSLAGELAPFGIRVVALVPGSTYSRMTEENYRKNYDRIRSSQAQQRIGTAEEIAAWAVFLASDAASYFTGNHVEISGGKYCVQDPIMAWKHYNAEALRPEGKA
jgi:NAD(P)-dependent dehydrogenase (short-subunit alcohol dehydrogenase family)